MFNWLSCLSFSFNIQSRSLGWSFNFCNFLCFNSGCFNWSCRSLRLSLLSLSYWSLNWLASLVVSSCSLLITIISISSGIVSSSVISNWAKCKCINPAITNKCTFYTVVISNILSNIYVLTNSCSIYLYTNTRINWCTHNWCCLCNCTIFVNNLCNGIIFVKTISCNHTIKRLSIIWISSVFTL